MNSRKKVAVLAASMVLSTSLSAFAMPLEKVGTGFAKNVIVLIPDGMSQGGVTLTRWLYNEGAPLNLDGITSGLVRTNNSDTPIADSAPAGTAMATGHKTQDKLIAVKGKAATLYGSNSDDVKEALAPLATVLELAKTQGKATGLVVTSEIMHATPADFSAHAVNRKNYNDISEQQVFQNMNVVFGGGYKFFTAADREDKQDLISEIKGQGYQLVADKKQFDAITDGKVFGLFAPSDLPYELDRKQDEPALSEMTSKAIQLLSKDKDGFFLMVEGSKVDWAAHNNAPAALTGDIKAFDDAVGMALNYAKTNKDTLVIVASDHGNGGISMGNEATSGNYSTLPINAFTDTLKKVQMTEETLAKAIIKNEEHTSDLIKTNFGFVPTEAELNTVIAADSQGAKMKALRTILNKRSNLGWTTGGHTGEDVALYVYANNYKNQLTGTVQNSDIGKYIAKAIGGELDKTSEQLFVPSTAFGKYGVKCAVDNSDAKNPSFVLTKNGHSYKFQENRNYFVGPEGKVTFNGVVVYNDKEVFIPQEALKMLK